MAGYISGYQVSAPMGDSQYRELHDRTTSLSTTATTPENIAVKIDQTNTILQKIIEQDINLIPAVSIHVV